jgi:hypothetical protein
MTCLIVVTCNGVHQNMSSEEQCVVSGTLQARPVCDNDAVNSIEDSSAKKSSRCTAIDPAWNQILVDCVAGKKTIRFIAPCELYPCARTYAAEFGRCGKRAEISRVVCSPSSRTRRDESGSMRSSVVHQTPCDRQLWCLRTYPLFPPVRLEQRTSSSLI